MSELVEAAKQAIDTVHQRPGEDIKTVLDDLEEVQEHLETLIDVVQDDMCKSRKDL